MSRFTNAGRRWRPGFARPAALALGAAAVALAAACAADRALSPHMASTQDQTRNYSRAGLDSLAASPAAFQAAMAQPVIAQPTVPQYVACAPHSARTGTWTVGPAGGTIHVGNNVFSVPAGALDTTTTLSVSVPSGTSAELDFGPHGLKFHAPVQMTIDYSGCLTPAGATLGVTYVDPVAGAATPMPAHQDAAAHTVTALTDHFSGYMVSWSAK